MVIRSHEIERIHDRQHLLGTPVGKQQAYLVIDRRHECIRCRRDELRITREQTSLPPGRRFL